MSPAYFYGLYLLSVVFSFDAVPCEKIPNEFRSYTYVARRQRNIFGRKPGRLSYFTFLKSERNLISVQLGGEAYHLSVREAPGLIFKISDIFNLEAYFLHDLTLYGFLKGFADFHKSGYQ